jgi:hypothetical protein
MGVLPGAAGKKAARRRIIDEKTPGVEGVSRQSTVDGRRPDE